MSCSCDFVDYISNCVEDIIVKGNFTPGFSYRYFLTDKFDKVYSKEVAADDEGNITIPITDFPEGFFNHHAGCFILRFETGVYEANAFIAIKDSNERRII